MRSKFGALLGAAGLLLLTASATLAVKPVYEISVSKTADPAEVPPSGGDVEFTVWVTGTGSGFFNTVAVNDPLAGCTLGAPVKTGGNTDSKLEDGETWAYSCTVEDVTPGTENTATVNACHDQSECAADHDATDTGSVTVTEGEEPTPTQDQGGATEPATDAITTGGPSSGANAAMFLVLALGVLLASIVLVTPKRSIRRRER